MTTIIRKNNLVMCDTMHVEGINDCTVKIKGMHKLYRHPKVPVIACISGAVSPATIESISELMERCYKAQITGEPMPTITDYKPPVGAVRCQAAMFHPEYSIHFSFVFKGMLGILDVVGKDTPSIIGSGHEFLPSKHITDMPIEEIMNYIVETDRCTGGPYVTIDLNELVSP